MRVQILGCFRALASWSACRQGVSLNTIKQKTRKVTQIYRKIIFPISLKRTIRIENIFPYIFLTYYTNRKYFSFITWWPFSVALFWWPTAQIRIFWDLRDFVRSSHFCASTLWSNRRIRTAISRSRRTSLPPLSPSCKWMQISNRYPNTNPLQKRLQFSI